MTETEEYEIIRCPFCGYQGIKAEPGKSVCPECETVFEIDDRGECVFVDLNYPRLPMEGTICQRCGPIQGEEFEKCSYCGSRLNSNLQ